MTKELVSDPISVHLTLIRATNFFLEKLCLRQSLDAMVSYHHLQYQKKLIMKSWGKLSGGRSDGQGKGGRTDGQTDEHTDQSYFIGRSRLTSSVQHNFQLY